MGRKHNLVERYLELRELEEIKTLLKKEEKKEDKKHPAWYASPWKLAAILMLCWPFIGLLQLTLLKATLTAAQRLLQ